MALFFRGRETMVSEVKGMNERLRRARISLKDTLAVIDMTLEDQFRDLEIISPYEVFEALNELTERTVHGTKIERFRPQEGNQPFHTFEIHSEDGEALGYLNMIYFRKPIPCYYLVYVEVLISFRGRGLGNKIIKAFREFVEDRGAVGLLDNIIPPEEPTYNIYTKLGWKGIEGLVGNGMVNGEGHYMVFVPTSIKTPDLKDKLIKLLFNLRKKRSIIDMHDNESMVKRTIAEFQSVYGALESLFDTELSTGTSTPLIRFMFTKFVTKVLGFQRRIGKLLGYTGGESLDQISISDRIKALPIQPCSLWGSKEGQAEIWGEEGIIRDLPEGLKKEPTHYIEDLPLYRRPYLYSWMERKGDGRSLDLRISDLLELGFDPTRLREFHHKGAEYIFERISPRFLPLIEKQRRFLSKVAESISGARFRNATIQVNPPIAILHDRGNVYILRRKVAGIHSEEALAQLRTSPYLKDMNRAAEIDRTVIMTIDEIRGWLMKKFDSHLREEIEELAFFVPWDLERNIPKVTADITGVSLDTMWIA
jgi:GNAT superfamily N-acetyltransferase